MESTTKTPPPDRLSPAIEQGLAAVLFQDGLLSDSQLLAARQYGWENGLDLRQSILKLKLMSAELLDSLIPDEPVSLSGEIEALTRVLIGPPPPDRSKLEREIRASLEEASVVTGFPVLVERVIDRACEARATDVHLDPQENGLRIRFRIDGQLHDVLRLDAGPAASVVTRLKVLANLNIVERRHPQDGRITIENAAGRHDLRIATLPTIHGEKAVIRLHEVMTQSQDFGALGFSSRQSEQLERLIARPYGALLVSGPVGSGKTTTLYSCLTRVNLPTRNVMTIEDPIECRMPGVNQMQVDNRGEVGFSEGLRGILRQDPDVVMIGEIRDDETAQIGVRASLTGVLVLSSVHAGDSASTVTSLSNFKIPPYLVSTALLGVVAQRLVRKICVYCRERYEADDATVLSLGLDPSEHRGLYLHRGRGCPACFGTGFLGRIGIYEIMEIDDALRGMIFHEAAKDDLHRAAVERGMATLRQSAVDKVLRGQTTIAEIHRAVMM